VKREQLAWVAGVFEGEGTIVRDGSRTRLQVGMADEDVVRRLAEASGMGTVSGPHKSFGPKGTDYQPRWRWSVARQSEVYALLAALWPWLGERRRARAKLALLEIGGQRAVLHG